MTVGDSHIQTFQWVAPIYGLFYNMQKRTYRKTLARYLKCMNLPPHPVFLDVGCGTGALCSVLYDMGYEVTGVDPAEKMLSVAKRRNAGKNIRFMVGNALEGLPFADDSFDCVCAAFVAHGFAAEERQKFYREMKRVSRGSVVLNDFNRRKSILIEAVERLERSDYKNFVNQVEDEMREHFALTQTIQIGPGTAWYIGRK